VARKFPHIYSVARHLIPQDASFLLEPYRARELLEAVLV
jgi:hypothetical protein